MCWCVRKRTTKVAPLQPHKAWHESTGSRHAAKCCGKENTGYQLLQAVKQSNLEQIKELIARGAYVEYEDRKGNTPLFLAACRGDMDTIKLLLGHGADINRVDAVLACSNLMGAVKYNRTTTVRHLLEHKASVNHQNKMKGDTALIWAAWYGHSVDLVKLLLQHRNIDTRIRGKFNQTALE